GPDYSSHFLHPCSRTSTRYLTAVRGTAPRAHSEYRRRYCVVAARSAINHLIVDLVGFERQRSRVRTMSPGWLFAWWTDPIQKLNDLSILELSFSSAYERSGHDPNENATGRGHSEPRAQPDPGAAHRCGLGTVS